MDAYLGEFEQLVLLAVLRLDGGAFGRRVGEEITRVTGRKPSSGALYTTLDRLEAKGYLEHRDDDSSEQRGGRPRRYLLITANGMAALQKSRRALMRMWRGYAEALDGRP